LSACSCVRVSLQLFRLFSLIDPVSYEFYTLSLHDALPISVSYTGCAAAWATRFWHLGGGWYYHTRDAVFSWRAFGALYYAGAGVGVCRRGSGCGRALSSYAPYVLYGSMGGSI